MGRAAAVIRRARALLGLFCALALSASAHSAGFVLYRGGKAPAPAAEAGGACGAGVFVHDTFDRANDATIIGDSPDLCGGVWTAQTGFTGDADITNSSATETAANGFLYADTAPSDADYEVETVIRATNTNDDTGGPGLGIDNTGATTNGIFAYFVAGASLIKLYERVGVTETLLCDDTLGGDPFVAPVTVKVKRVGTTAELHINGSLSCSQTTNVTAVGRPGIYTAGLTNVSYAYLKATN